MHSCGYWLSTLLAVKFTGLSIGMFDFLHELTVSISHHHDLVRDLDLVLACPNTKTSVENTEPFTHMEGSK
jgi:hypothetical protein